MSKPIVAIVGRPNVGKSTFFNKIVGRRISIVEDTPGVTRDRIYAEAEWNGTNFALIDTGGIEPASQDVILSQMREQAQIAMDLADVILFITDRFQPFIARISTRNLHCNVAKPTVCFRSVPVFHFRLYHNNHSRLQTDRFPSFLLIPATSRRTN